MLSKYIFLWQREMRIAGPPSGQQDLLFQLLEGLWETPPTSPPQRCPNALTQGAPCPKQPQAVTDRRWVCWRPHPAPPPPPADSKPPEGMAVLQACIQPLPPLTSVWLPAFLPQGGFQGHFLKKENRKTKKTETLLPESASWKNQLASLLKWF